jgi:hypothetical protein
MGVFLGPLLGPVPPVLRAPSGPALARGIRTRDDINMSSPVLTCTGDDNDMSLEVHTHAYITLERTCTGCCCSGSSSSSDVDDDSGGGGGEDDDDDGGGSSDDDGVGGNDDDDGSGCGGGRGDGGRGRRRMGRGGR